MSATQQYTDQTGFPFAISHTPKRIVSLVPSQTELLHHLGLKDEVVGITKFCIYPDEWYRTKPRIGGTKQVDINRVRSLQPDLILGNKEENSKNDIEELRQEFPVWMSDIYSLGDATEMIRSIGTITGKTIESEQLAAAIEDAFTRFSIQTPQSTPLRVAYLIWKNPLMAAGNDTFIHTMLRACGWVNCFGHLSRYPEVTESMIRETAPDVILLSTEPYPFQPSDLREFGSKFSDCNCLLADGEYFSWYGSRLLQAPGYFLKLKDELSELRQVDGSTD